MLTSPQYIVPLFRKGYFCGTGFIVGDLLITAGHVMGETEDLCRQISAFICGERVSYMSYRRFFHYLSVNETDPNHADIAAFRIPQDIAKKVNSPLRFPFTDVLSEQIARSLYFMPSDNEVGYVYEETDLIVTRRVAFSNMFFGIEWPTCFSGVTNSKLTHGASGSPVIDENNNVLGVLIIGYDRFKVDESIIEGSRFSREQLNQYKNACLFFKGSEVDYLVKYHNQKFTL